MTQDLLGLSPETEVRDVSGTDIVYYLDEPIVQLGRKKALDDFHCHPEPGYKVGRCKMVKKDGGRCKNAVRPGWTVCRYHGAGTPSNPGGRPLMSGRHSIHLPRRFHERYEQLLNDPDYLVMRQEIALLDTRLGEILEKLDTAGSKQAWMSVRRAYSVLQKAEVGEDELGQIEEYLEQALEMVVTETEVWDEITDLIEARRKVADTERRRIVDAQRFLTYDEANAMMLFLVSTVKEFVTDEDVLAAILDKMKVFSQ